MDLGKKDLSVYHNQLTLINATAAQVQKDFQLYGEEIIFVEGTSSPYDQLFDQVKPIIFRMLELDSTRFFSLLYAIDVEENKIKELLLGTKDSDVANELTHLILERELLKVLSRQIFSQQGNI